MKGFINRVDFCEAVHVHAAADLEHHQVVITDFVPWSKIPTLDFSSVEEIDVQEEQQVYDIKLTSSLAERMIFPSCGLVFRLTDVYGQNFLLGLPELCPPFPLVKQEERWAGKPNDSQLCRLSVSLKSSVPLLKIVTEIL